MFIQSIHILFQDKAQARGECEHTSVCDHSSTTATQDCLSN